LAIVVARRSWLEISLWKTGKDRKKEKEHTRKKEKEHTRKKEKEHTRKKEKEHTRKKEKEGTRRREMVSEQPSSTAEIR